MSVNLDTLVTIRNTDFNHPIQLAFQIEFMIETRKVNLKYKIRQVVNGTNFTKFSYDNVTLITLYTRDILITIYRHSFHGSKIRAPLPSDA